MVKDNKMKIVERFTSELMKKAKENIYGIYLFGSLAKDKTCIGSDIDLLVIYSNGKKLYSMEDIVDEVCFKLGCQLNESPEVILISEDEYKNEAGKSPFLWEVLNFGKAIFVREKATEWELDYKDFLVLAEEYLNYAKHSLKENMIRLAIDAGYNCAELLVKSLIISTKSELASSHGGIVGQFGQLFVTTGKISSDIGKELNKALRLRALARYKPKANLTTKEDEFVISLSERLLSFAKKEL